MSFDGIFYAPFSLEAEADRTGATLTVAGFNPINYISAPAGATHFRLINAVSVISRLCQENEQSKVYEAIAPDLNELSSIAYSDYLSLSEALATDTVVTATLPGSPTMTADVSVINCVGIEFYQQVGANYYLFNSGNALKVQAVF